MTGRQAAVADDGGVFVGTAVAVAVLALLAVDAPLLDADATLDGALQAGTERVS